jgi:glycosyltransferase involved in cell wall biosynthesis
MESYYLYPRPFCLPIKIPDFKNRKIKILLPSRICEQKNQLDLLNYLELNPSILSLFHFDFVGPIYDFPYYDKILTKLNNNMLLNNSITVNNIVKDIGLEFEKADVILLNSIFEGFSNVILESWYYSKILIVSKSSDPNKIIMHSFNGFCFDSYEKLNEILFALINLTDSDKSNIILNGNSSLLNFSFEKVAIEYFSQYKNLLK